MDETTCEACVKDCKGNTPTPSTSSTPSTQAPTPRNLARILVTNAVRVIARYYITQSRTACGVRQHPRVPTLPVLTRGETQRLAELFWATCACEIRHRGIRMYTYWDTTASDVCKWLDTLDYDKLYDHSHSREQCLSDLLDHLDNTSVPTQELVSHLRLAAHAFAGKWSDGYGGVRWAYAAWHGAEFIDAVLTDRKSVDTLKWERWLYAAHNNGPWLNKVDPCGCIHPITLALNAGRDDKQSVLQELLMEDIQLVTRRHGCLYTQSRTLDDFGYWERPPTACVISSYQDEPNDDTCGMCKCDPCECCGKCGHVISNCQCCYNCHAYNSCEECDECIECGKCKCPCDECYTHPCVCDATPTPHCPTCTHLTPYGCTQYSGDYQVCQMYKEQECLSCLFNNECPNKPHGECPHYMKAPTQACVYTLTLPNMTMSLHTGDSHEQATQTKAPNG